MRARDLKKQNKKKTPEQKQTDARRWDREVGREGERVIEQLGEHPQPRTHPTSPPRPRSEVHFSQLCSIPPLSSLETSRRGPDAARDDGGSQRGARLERTRVFLLHSSRRQKNTPPITQHSEDAVTATRIPGIFEFIGHVRVTEDERPS